ncbi:hypothetical protein ACFL1M_00925 [Patescibacteria group bacterium]
MRVNIGYVLSRVFGVIIIFLILLVMLSFLRFIAVEGGLIITITLGISMTLIFVLVRVLFLIVPGWFGKERVITLAEHTDLARSEDSSGESC